MYKKFILISITVLLVSCATNQYKGMTTYYTNQHGVDMECREPRPYKGGNCLPTSLWLDKGKN